MHRHVTLKDEENTEWLVLESYPEWAEPMVQGQDKWKQPHKRMWYHINSYLVSEDESKKFTVWATEQNFMNSRMPKTSDQYQIFDGEYFWSPAFEYFNNYYYGGLEHHEIKDRSNGDRICDVMLSSTHYCWEKGIDNSIEGAFNILKPSKFIFDNMKLIPTDKVAEYKNEHNNIICYSPTVYQGSKPILLIDKKEFIDFLQKNKLKIVWTVQGEKNIIGGNSHGDEYQGRLEINGTYYLNDSNNIEGNINMKKT